MVSISNLKERVEEKCVTHPVLSLIIYKCNIKVYKFIINHSLLPYEVAGIIHVIYLYK